MSFSKKKNGFVCMESVSFAAGEAEQPGAPSGEEGDVGGVHKIGCK